MHVESAWKKMGYVTERILGESRLEQGVVTGINVDEDLGEKYLWGQGE